MKILHVIDSLELGGAERVAVNLSNALAEELGQSFLCVTRRHGLLESLIADAVEVIFLDRRAKLDPSALSRLSRFITENGITWEGSIAKYRSHHNRGYGQPRGSAHGSP